MDTSFWRDKRVFVTGHTGFKGGWLCLWLQNLGAQVCGYALEPDIPQSMFLSARVDESMESHIGDVRDYNELHRVLKSFKPDVVFHLAAQPLVRYSYSHPVETFSTNVMGTVNLLETIRHVGGVRSVVNITTDKCYEITDQKSYQENDRLGGYDPYSNSKACSELVTSSYRQSFFNESTFPDHLCAIASARAGNVIGGGDWALDRLVPDLLKSFQVGEKVNIRNPVAVRPWQHVLEPLSGYLSLAERLYTVGMEFSEAWNFGPKESHTVEKVVKQLGDIWGADPNSITSRNESDAAHEASYLDLDISKAMTRLNWQPLLSLSESLHLVVKWHQAWNDGLDMKEFSIQEVETYQLSKENNE